MRRNQDWDLLLSRHRTCGNAVWVCLLLEVPRLGTRCGVSESEGVIIKALVSLSRTLLPPLRSLWLAHSSGQEEVGRGTLPLHEAGTHAASGHHLIHLRGSLSAGRVRLGGGAAPCPLWVAWREPSYQQTQLCE